MDFLGACFFGLSEYILCLYIIEDKLHLGKFIQTSLMSLHSICIIFVKKRMIGRIAGHRGDSRFP